MRCLLVEADVRLLPSDIFELEFIGQTLVYLWSIIQISPDHVPKGTARSTAQAGQEIGPRGVPGPVKVYQFNLGAVVGAAMLHILTRSSRDRNDLGSIYMLSGSTSRRELLVTDVDRHRCPLHQVEVKASIFVHFL